VVRDAEGKVLGEVALEQGIKRCIAEREFAAFSFHCGKGRVEV
jgi:hypothetical protein